ncbi:MAG: phage Gp37/Gp68 family protein [Actinomycetota bacterium]|nr:phage Gp37/Gp68 family protein [Actinomycetota bacterium]
MARSAIEWTESTWNPVTGCTKISPGCQHCYAERMSKRLQAMGHPNYVNGFELAMHEHALELPLRWRRPQVIFVNSMSDLFHRGVSSEFISKVFRVMSEAQHHRFQVLTKRSKRLRELAPELPWLPNMWMGVSVESSDYALRIDHLRDIGAHIRFVSFEPLLGPIRDLDLAGIDWVIVGGESGPKARPMKPSWVREIRDQCLSEKVPFFFKQWGGVNKKRNGRVLDGRIWDQMLINNLYAKCVD